MSDVLFGLFLIVLGAVIAVKTRAFLSGAKRVQGEVVGYDSRLDSEGDLIHTPIFGFIDEHVHAITAVNPRTGSGEQKHRIGARLRLV